MAYKEKIHQLIEIKPELTQMLELANKDIETVITACHMFKKFSRDIKDIFKYLNKMYRSENYNMWG